MEKILYIEDMEKCHKLTQQALGDSYKISSILTPKEAYLEIMGKINEYSAMISDFNLVYDESKPYNEQSSEGLELIALARKESERRGILKFPIFCISSDSSHRKPSLKAGANIFMYKKDFWDGRGKRYLDAIIKHKKKEWKIKKIKLID